MSELETEAERSSGLGAEAECPLCGKPATSMPWSPPEFPERLCDRCLDGAPEAAGIQAALIAKRKGAPQEVIEALRDAIYP